MSADYSFYALMCGYMPRPEGVLKGKDESLSLFCAPLGSENPGVASLPGRLGGCKLSSTRLPTASSAVEPLRGYRSEKRKFLAFFMLLSSGCAILLMRKNRYPLQEKKRADLFGLLASCYSTSRSWD